MCPITKVILRPAYGNKLSNIICKAKKKEEKNYKSFQTMTFRILINSVDFKNGQTGGNPVKAGNSEPMIYVPLTRIYDLENA